MKGLPKDTMDKFYPMRIDQNLSDRIQSFDKLKENEKDKLKIIINKVLPDRAQAETFIRI